MTDKRKPTEALVALIKGVADFGNPKAYAVYKAKGQPKYRPLNESVSVGAVTAHLTSEQPIGCYFVIGNMTHVAVVDFDDHDGDMLWDDMVSAAHPIIKMLNSLGIRTLCCRSGGGAGIHVWMFWEKAQSAQELLTFLRSAIKECGFAHGTKGGVQNSVVEVFPKNRQVKGEQLGNLIALPFARKSVPLDEKLQPIDWADYNPPSLRDLYSTDISKISTPIERPELKKDQHHETNVTVVLRGGLFPGDEIEARLALKFIAADDYDIWVKVGLALMQSFGSGAFELWDEWASKSAKYEGSEACRAVWDTFTPDGSLTIGTVFYLAKENGWEGPKNAVVREMNERYGIWTHGSTTRIIVKQPLEEEALTTLGKGAFLDRLKPEKFPEENGNGETKLRPKGPYWLGHQYAAHYHQVIFDPTKPPGEVGKSWNMWQGFAVEPKPGDWSLLQHHILVNICGGNEEYAAWMMNWMALGLQQPGLVIGTAPVLKGLPGTGKGVLANLYGHLWGVHYVSVTKDDHVSGRFNQHLEARRLVYVDEAMFGGDRKNAGVIKTMLTEPRIMIERKGVDPVWLDNHMIFIVTSNENSTVPADIGDRRWQAIKVADTHRGDRAYFGAIFAQMRSGGYEAMMHDLLKRDISVGPDPQVTIRTPELFDEIIQAQGPTPRYLYQVLDAGYLPQPDAPGNGPGITTIAAMYDDMKRSQPNTQFIHQTLFGRDIRKVLPGLTKVQSGQYITGRDAMGRVITERSTRYHFPSLLECRRAFERYIGQDIPWSNDLSEWQGDIDPAYDYSFTRDGDPEPPF